MAAELFRRVARLTVMVPIAGAGFLPANRAIHEITDLRLQFKVTKHLGKAPNTGAITIVNLNAESRAAFQRKDCAVLLEAGYPTTIAKIFLGDVRVANSRHEGTQWMTTLEAGDGERAYLHPRANESFKGGTSAATVVEKLGRVMGLDVGNLQAQASELAGHQYVNGRQIRGRASRELDRILRSHRLEWSIQDGALQVLRPGQALQYVVDLGPDTGLVGTPDVGTPEKKKKRPTIKWRSKLIPEIKPGGIVNLRSSVHTGRVRVTEITHLGDTSSGDWYTDGEGEPV